MTIAGIVRSKDGREPIFSFEFFPPKTEKGEEALYRAVGELKPLSPDFVSVTYGAGGSTRDRTIDWVARIRDEHAIETMAHLTCVGASRDELARILAELMRRGVENVLALRGDPPRGEANFTPAKDGFRYASELVAFIRARHPGFSIGVAGYPEKHPEASTMDEDVRRLGEKIRAGADFVVTQLFFENDRYFEFARRVREIAGRGVPVIPGLMPITAKSQIERFISMCGARVPEDLKERIAAAEDDDAAAEIGIAYATSQARELLAGGAPGIHFYTLNKSDATRRILKAIRTR